VFGIGKKHKKQLSDQELLEKISANNYEAALIGELFARYTHMVYGVCMKYLEDSDDAADAVMNIYEKLCAEMHKHQINCFATWLYVTSRNFCLMQLRTKKAMQHRHALWEKDQEIFMENSFVLHPLDDTENGNHTQKLHDCIENLKHEQKACVRLFYFEDKCYQEIAHQLQIEEKQVKSHLQNGKRNLSICLENANGHE